MNERSFTGCDMSQPRPVTAFDQRTSEILEGASVAFSSKGFDGASMQDLARSAGMSVGNFYRYFPSKAAIVAALIERSLVELEQDFAALLEEDDLMGALRRKIADRIDEARCQGEGQLWAEINAASLRKPEIAQLSCRMEDEIVSHMVRVFARATQISPDEAHGRWSSHARMIVMMVKSCAMRPPVRPAAADLHRLVRRTLNLFLKYLFLPAVKG